LNEAATLILDEGIDLLLIPEIVALKGEIETHAERGSIYDPPVAVPPILLDRTDELYVLGGIGGRLLQTIGIVNGVGTQTRRFQAAGTMNGVPIESKR
jgi:thiamine pyrophosphokinase